MASRPPRDEFFDNLVVKDILAARKIRAREIDAVSAQFVQSFVDDLKVNNLTVNNIIQESSKQCGYLVPEAYPSIQEAINAVQTDLIAGTVQTAIVVTCSATFTEDVVISALPASSTLSIVSKGSTTVSGSVTINTANVQLIGLHITGSVNVNNLDTLNIYSAAIHSCTMSSVLCTGGQISILESQIAASGITTAIDLSNLVFAQIFRCNVNAEHGRTLSFQPNTAPAGLCIVLQSFLFQNGGVGTSECIMLSRPLPAGDIPVAFFLTTVISNEGCTNLIFQNNMRFIGNQVFLGNQRDPMANPGPVNIFSLNNNVELELPLAVIRIDDEPVANGGSSWFVNSNGVASVVQFLRLGVVTNEIVSGATRQNLSINSSAMYASNASSSITPSSVIKSTPTSILSADGPVPDYLGNSTVITIVPPSFGPVPTTVSLPFSIQSGKEYYIRNNTAGVIAVTPTAPNNTYPTGSIVPAALGIVSGGTLHIVLVDQPNPGPPPTYSWMQMGL